VVGVVGSRVVLELGRLVRGHRLFGWRLFRRRRRFGRRRRIGELVRI